ncbi:Bug family tripartite tricarboxylate transporter substrate binding protein [Sphaerotilus microaerophilus]|nr:tripartite tricarboxylate transporter substrate binding protein [Sphaerotilus sp. FB-5]
MTPLPVSSMRRRLITVLAAGGLWPALAAAQLARTATLLVPQPAGNPTDALARKLQPLLQKALGQTTIVENLPGAGGSLGVSRLLATPAEQTVLVVASQTEPILTPLAFASARYKPEDLRPVGLVGRTPYVLVGRPDLPATNMTELVALASQPGSQPLSLGHIGQGSMIHLLGEQWARRLGLSLNLVPYRGLPPVVQDLMGGQLDLTFLPLGGNSPALIETGKLRAYGVSSPAVAARLPKLPTLSSTDRRLADFVHHTWAALFVSRSLPAGEVQRLHAAVAASLADPEVIRYSQSTGVEVASPMSLEELERFYAGETRQYQALAKSLGVLPQ